MQINGNIVVLPVPPEKQNLAYLPDRFETGERVQTPRAVSYTHLFLQKQRIKRNYAKELRQAEKTAKKMCIRDRYIHSLADFSIYSETLPHRSP